MLRSAADIIVDVSSGLVDWGVRVLRSAAVIIGDVLWGLVDWGVRVMVEVRQSE